MTLVIDPKVALLKGVDPVQFCVFMTLVIDPKVALLKGVGPVQFCVFRIFRYMAGGFYKTTLKNQFN